MRLSLIVPAVVLVAVAVVGRAGAQTPPFTAALDRAAAAPGEPFVYEVTLTLGDESLDDFRAPDFRGLTVVSAPSGPNRAMSVQMGGGQTQVENRLSWRFELALPAGAKNTVTIGAAHARVAGHDIASNVVPVRVGASGTAPPSGGLRGGGGLFPRGLFPSGVLDDEPSDEAISSVPGVAFIRAVADKPRAFVGEQVTVTWYLYLTEPQNNFQPMEQPRTDGFWSEELPSTNPQGRLAFSDRVEGGRRYQVAILLAKALFPLRPGKLTVTPMEAEVSQADFFGRRVHPLHLKSAPITIDALALPREGRPAQFASGNVGRYTVEAVVDRTAVALGDAVTLIVTVKGTGNVRSVEVPALPSLEGWKSYEPKTSVTVEPGAPMSGTKTVEWLVRPERSGKTIFPPFSIPAFDPGTKRYQDLRTKPLEIVVRSDGTAGVATSPAGNVPSPTGVENVIFAAIRPIRVRSNPGREAGVSFLRGPGFTATVVVPPVAFVALVVGGRLRRRLGADTGRNRRRRLRNLARRRLRAADGHRAAGQAAAFHVEIDRVLRDVLSERLGVPVGGLLLHELRALLETRGLPDPEIARLTQALEAGDEARFAPGQQVATPAALSTALAEAGELIELIEKAPLIEGRKA